MIVWLSAILILACIIISRRRKPGLPYPPGPPGLPLIGNALDFPKSNYARALHEIAARYGSVTRFSVLGRTLIVIDSYEAACGLLDKKAKNYSDRPQSVVARLTSLPDFNLPLIPYGPKWRRHRRIYHQTLQLSVVNKCYHSNLRQVTQGFLQNLLDKPEDFWRHISHVFVASVLSVGYGIKIPNDDDYYGNLLHHILRIMEGLVIPGKYLVELLPALERLPRWFPGARFKKDADVVREGVTYARRLLYEEGKRTLRSGTTGDSMLAIMHQRVAALDGEAAEDEEEECTGALIGTYMAGSDTTIASLQALFLAMAMYPEVQRKAQAELDRVVGHARLPDFDDRDNLPYINAVLKELTRWNVVAPTALPHTALEDDEYDGYHIPRGAFIIPNLWAISRDTDVYPDPETFIPDRFLKDGQLYPGARDPYSFIFGFGRRNCPGRHLADASLFLTCASILHTFNISPPLDDNGHPMKLEARIDTDGVIAHPKQFDCIVEPRWAGVADLIRA